MTLHSTANTLAQVISLRLERGRKSYPMGCDVDAEAVRIASMVRGMQAQRGS